MINFFKNIKNRNKFIVHNKKLFVKKNKSKRNIILVEFNKWAYLHIIKSYICNILAKKYNAQIIAFESYTLLDGKVNKSLLKQVLIKTMQFFGFGNFGVYNSFGINNFISPSINLNFEKKKIKLINNILKQVKNNNQLMNLKIDKIYIGDLIYDTYLKINKVPTIDVNSDEFQIFLKKCIILFYWWKDFFKENKDQIKALVIVHSVYLFGLQARIASYYNIDSFKISHKNITRINNKNLYAYNDVMSYLHIFEKIKNKTLIYKKTKKEINLILSGKNSVGKNYNDRLKRKLFFETKKNQIKVLISCHSFFDAPHSFGKFFKNDFYEWLELLGKVSQKTDYLWLLKPHPITYQEDLPYLEKIMKRYPKLKLIDKKYSNNEILKIGIDVALTCFGSVSFEYPYIGVKVINFTKHHPYQHFHFSYTPKNLHEYIKILKNLKKFRYTYKLNEILKFYYIKRFILNIDYMQFNFNKKKDFNGYLLKNYFFTTNFYNDWINNWNKKKHKKIMNIIENFVESKNLFMSNVKINENSSS